MTLYLTEKNNGSFKLQLDNSIYYANNKKELHELIKFIYDNPELFLSDI
jgi:hypothetical protein